MKLIKNKTLLLSVFTFLFSLFCFVTIGFAWVSISKTANVESFVGVVGDNTLEYQFSQVIDNDLIHSHNVSTEDVMPGEINTFVLTVENRGTLDALVDVDFTKIYSEIDLGQGFTKEYTNLYQKIQYAYSYCIDLVAYVPDDLKIENEYGSNLVKIPTDEEIIEKGWIKVSRNTNYTYFNKITSDNKDAEDYSMVSKLDLKHKVKGSNSVQNKSTVLIYFTVKFNNEPKIPSIITNVPDGLDFNEEYYANQRFHISNIVIKGLD